jgi:hypothetical protein
MEHSSIFIDKQYQIIDNRKMRRFGRRAWTRGIRGQVPVRKSSLPDAVVPSTAMTMGAGMDGAAIGMGEH